MPTRLGSGATTHINASWPDITCYGPPCADGTSTTFGVDQVIDGFVFSLDRGGSIRGSVVGESSHLPLPATVWLLSDAFGNLVRRGFLDGTNASYASYGLPPGIYYAEAGGEGLACEQYAEQPCDPFWGFPERATLIVITGTSIIEHVDFTLDESPLFANGFER